MQNPISTILVVDDEKININILNGLLSEDYDVVSARDGETALEIVDEENIDLILLDIMMPEMDGLVVCKILKANPKHQNIPVIFITAKTDDDSIEIAYDVGGSDYITKPFRPKELMARVNLNLKLSKTLKDLDYMATRDFMTGIYNRRKFFELGNERFNTEENLFAVMIDIDKFKNVNDSYGHPFGDIVIKGITKIVEQHINEKSIFGRLGGEEFALICCSFSIENVKNSIEEIREKIENNIFEFEGKLVKVTISSGISKKETNDSLDLLLKRADEALYDAKEGGRNRTFFRV